MKKVYILAAIILLIVVGGFYFVLDYLNGLNNTIQNLQAQLQLRGSQTPATATTSAATAISPTPTSTASNSGAISIPTSIIFNTQSSPLLTPQTTLTVTVPDVSKATDGTITVDVKFFSNIATSYSAVNPSDLFQLVDLTNGNQSPLTVTGSFNSIPPQSAAAGSLNFKIDPSQNTIILQIGSGNQFKYYKFDFTNQTYQETVLG